MLKLYQNKLDFNLNDHLVSSISNTCSNLSECKENSKETNEYKFLNQNFNLNQLILEKNKRKKFYPK